MAGQIIVVQKKITLNFSNQAGGTSYDYTHVVGINLVHAREFILNVRLTQRNIGSGASAIVNVRPYYPDAEDAADVVGANIAGLAVNLATAIAVVPGGVTVSQRDAIPVWVRIVTTFSQPATPVALMATYSIDAAARD